MRDDQIREILRNSNPWWRTAITRRDPQAWVSSHRLMRDRTRYDLNYRSPLLDDIAYGPLSDSLIIVTGPRRVGKSVLLLDTAATLCGRDDVDPRQVIHLPADGFSAQDLRRAFVLGREETRSVDLSCSKRRVWLLDEVSGVPNWTTTLKGLRDQTLVGDDTVIATGSRWLGREDVTADLLAGRAGSGDHRRLRHLWPMSFRDFAASTGRDLPDLPAAPLWDLQSPETRAVLESCRPFVDEFDLAWQAYAHSGGFPRAVHEYMTLGGITPGYARDLEAWLIADLAEDESPDSVAFLLSGLLGRATSPLNASKAARDLGYSTTVQFERRLTRLKSTFAALECPQRDTKGHRIARTQSKIYLTDPILAWLPSLLSSGLPSPDLTAVTEMTLGTQLAQALDSFEEGRWVNGNTIGYARTDSGREVDFCPVSIRTPAEDSMTIPLEGKWVPNAWRPEALVMENKYGRGILATRNIIDTDNPTWAVPAPVLALLIR